MEQSFEVVKCVGCYYYRRFSATYGRNTKCCHYALETGEIRGMLPVECYKHEGTPYTTRRINRKQDSFTIIKRKRKMYAEGDVSGDE